MKTIMLYCDDNTMAIRIGKSIIDRFTIPLVFDERYFICERIGESEFFTVFWFKNNTFILDFFRNQPMGINPYCWIEEDGSLVNTVGPNGTIRYRIIPKNYPQGSFIEVAGVSLHRFPIDNGMVLVDNGHTRIMNRLINGIPLGMHVYPDSSVRFHVKLPDQVIELLIPRDTPMSAPKGSEQ